MKGARNWSFSGPYFSAFGLNHSVSLCIQSKCGKIRTRKTPNMDTFHGVEVITVLRTQKCLLRKLSRNHLPFVVKHGVDTTAYEYKMAFLSLWKNPFNILFDYNFCKIAKLQLRVLAELFLKSLPDAWQRRCS